MIFSIQRCISNVSRRPAPNSVGGYRVHYFASSALASFLILLGLPAIAQAACQNVLESAPRWTWDDLWYSYSGSLNGSDVASGIGAWNSRQSKTVISYDASYPDVQASDSTSIGSNMGLVIRYHYGNGGSGGGPQACYLRSGLNCSHICFNSSRLYRVDMRFQPNNIAGAASDWASYFQMSGPNALSHVVKATAAHEMGHVLGLGEGSGPHNCTDPTIMSVHDVFYCVMWIPNPVCDTNSVNATYSGWTMYNWSSCQLCNLQSSCSN
jgi:hypothetical protein